MTDLDQDNQPITYTLQNNYGFFSIDPINGEIRTGFDNSHLDDGPIIFVLTISATDGTSNDTAQITIDTSQGSPNTAPVVTITNPSVSTSVVQGTNINFVGLASDTEEGDLGASIAWSSNLDGALGTGSILNVSGLSVGSHTITASVTDSGSLSGNATVSVTVTDPSGPSLSNVTVSVAEDVALSTTVTDLNDVNTGNDTDSDGDAITYSITGGNVGNAFAIDPISGVIRTAAVLDYETTVQYVLTVQASAGGLTDTAQATVDVTSVNDNTPVFTSPSSVSIAENTTSVVTLTATDADLPGDTLTYSISGGADQALFSLTGGILSFISAPDFEAPGDADADNVYNLDVSVSDGAASVVQSLVITVTDVADTGGTPLSQSAPFDTGADGFGYVDDPFLGTSEPTHSNGSYQSAGGFSGGGLEVVLGGVVNSQVDNISGGWQTSFTLDSTQDVTLSLRYKMVHAAGYETDEYSEVLLSLDGVLQGVGGNRYLARIDGDGNSGSDLTTGWVQETLDFGILSAGTYTVVIGGYNNKYTYSNEFTTVSIDDVIITGTLTGG